MTPKDLKNSILQLAIQGKLVEQRAEEGTAEELYQEIQKEKAALIKAGKIKKQKPLPVIKEEEKPFDIPEGWKWVHWGEVINIVSARRVHQSDWKSEGIPFYRAREIARLAKYGYVDNELFISIELFDEFSKSGVPQPGDLMVTAVGTLGKTYIVKKGDCFYYKDASVICFENFGKIVPEYLKYIMQSELMNGQIKENSSGTTVATLTMARMSRYIFPLPPLAEQQRIVAKIEELLPLVERYEAAYNKLETLNKRFPDDLKKSILQLAIQGKLVEQRAEEGTAEELYQQIQKEKAALIKTGKIKKQKLLPEIKEEEKPFDIPKSWKWVYIGDVFLHNTGKAQNASGSSNGIVRKFITTSNLYWNRFDFSKVKEMPFTKQELERCTVQKGDLLVCEGGDCGRSAIWNYDEEVCIQNHVHRLRSYSEVAIEYFYYLFYLYKFTGRLRGRGVAIQGLSTQAIHKILIPLPPLAEQHRIVAKIEELLPLCEQLR